MKDAEFHGNLSWHVFRLLGIEPKQITGGSNLTAIFTSKGPTVRIGQAHLANNISALEVETGGVVDLWAGNVDFYVVGAPLKDVRRFVAYVPIIDMVADLTDTLSRLHVKGHWTSSPDKLVSKQPLQDISEGTVNFFRSAMVGGKASMELLKGAGSLLGLNQDANK